MSAKLNVSAENKVRRKKVTCELLIVDCWLLIVNGDRKLRRIKKIPQDIAAKMMIGIRKRFMIR